MPTDDDRLSVVGEIVPIMETDPIRAASLAFTGAEDAHLSAYLRFVEARRQLEVIELEAMLCAEEVPAEKRRAADDALRVAQEAEGAARSAVYEADRQLGVVCPEWAADADCEGL